MPKLPRYVSGREVVKLFEKIGYWIVLLKGAHIRVKDDNNPNRLLATVPDHKRTNPCLLRQILRSADLTIDEFSQIIRVFRSLGSLLPQQNFWTPSWQFTPNWDGEVFAEPKNMKPKKKQLHLYWWRCINLPQVWFLDSKFLPR